MSKIIIGNELRDRCSPGEMSCPGHRGRRLPAIAWHMVMAAIWLVWAGIAAAENTAGRPSSWAQPMEIEGVPNLHQVSSDLYRSAQPTAAGMKKLKEMGIETVVNLRSFHSDRDLILGTGLGYEHLYMKAWHPERKEILRFLRIVMNPGRTPVLVHCQHGADRTGTMTALYRIIVQGWTKEEAIREMTEGGFGFHGVWENLRRWINELDITGLKRDLGMVEAARHASAVVMSPPAGGDLKNAAGRGCVVLAPEEV